MYQINRCLGRWGICCFNLPWSLMDFWPREKNYSFLIWRTSFSKSYYSQHHVPLYSQTLHPNSPFGPRAWTILGRFVVNHDANPRLCRLRNDNLKLHKVWWFQKHFRLRYLFWSVWLPFKPNNIISIFNFGESIWCVQGHTESGRAGGQNHFIYYSFWNNISVLVLGQYLFNPGFILEAF